MPERLGLIAILLIVIAAIACGQSEPIPVPTTAIPQIVVVTATAEPAPVPEIPTPQVIVVTATSEPVSTPPIPQPTYTPYPTQAPLPTYTPYPTPTLMPTSIPTEIPAPISVSIAVPTATSQPQTVASGNIVAGPTNTPTAIPPTPEPLLTEGCIQSGEESEFVVPTRADGTTKKVEPLPGVIFQDTIPAYQRSKNERTAWFFRELSYQHCETEDPWKPEYLVIEGREVEPPPWEQGEFVKKVFALSRHERNESRDVIYTSSQFLPHSDSGGGYRDWVYSSYSTLELSDPNAVLYLWTNLKYERKIGTDDHKWYCIEDATDEDDEWDEDVGCGDGGWHWKAVSTGRWGWEFSDFWYLPLISPRHTPAVFAVVAKK